VRWICLPRLDQLQLSRAPGRTTGAGRDRLRSQVSAKAEVLLSFYEQVFGVDDLAKGPMKRNYGNGSGRIVESIGGMTGAGRRIGGHRIGRYTRELRLVGRLVG
jgi:hypothetical protein